MSVAENLRKVRETIGDRPVTLVAATKYATIEQMHEAYAAGVRVFAENRVQDALQKMSHFPARDYPDLDWHFIGHLQTNKVRKALKHFKLIHSIDSTRLAEALSYANREAGTVQAILLQVNISGEPARFGFDPEEVSDAVGRIAMLPGLKVRGLMGMAPHIPDSGLLKQVFCDLKSLRDEVETTCAIPMPDLSMGMSNDFMHALECGATIVRLGSCLFRTTNESA